MTITKENFFDVWKKIDLKYRYSKKCVVIGKFINAIGDFVLAAGIIATVYYVSEKEAAELKMFLNYLGICMGIVIAICVCWTVLVHIIYHPFKTKYKEDAWAENAKIMVEMASKIRTNVKATKKGISNLAWVIYVLATMIDVIAEYAGIWDSYILKILPPNLINMEEGGLIIMPIIELVCLCFLHIIFKFITRWLYFCPVSYKEVLHAEAFLVEIEEGVSEKTEKERLVLSDVFLENGVLALGRGEVEDAKEYFLKSAILGNVVGMDRLALLHAGAERDKEIAIYWYKKCIDSGVATKDTKKHLRMVKNSIKVDNYY